MNLMNTLIELLNEYEEDKIKGTKGLSVMFVWKYEGVLYYYDNYKDDNVFDNIRLVIISKEYGFIEWLVKNNKIDFDKLSKKEIESRVSIVMVGEFIETNWVLMLLSISDTPIEDLISYLK